MNLIEEAVAKSYLFVSSTGHTYNIVDLYKLPLLDIGQRGNPCLDDIAKTIFTELEKTRITSFVLPTTDKNTLLQKKLDVVKHVIDYKKAQDTAAEQAISNKSKRDNLLRIADEVEQKELLEGKSSEELRKLASKIKV